MDCRCPLGELSSQQGKPVRVPNSEQDVIEERKLRDYFPSSSHPIGRFKAAFFAGLGYCQADWAKLEEDIRTQHLPHEAQESDGPYGRKYRIDAPLVGPNGKRAEVVTIWIVERGEGHPRFVTALPGGG